jgi:uncharacterized protein
MIFSIAFFVPILLRRMGERHLSNFIKAAMSLSNLKTINIFVDADSCPVKQEVYRVAARYGLSVTLVSNSNIRLPEKTAVKLVVVDGGLDAADDWIAEHATDNDIVVSADIPLAARCIKKGAKAIGPKGHTFTEESIGNALATRELMNHLRDLGEIQCGPAPFEKRDRSRFLHQLDEIIQALLRETN